MTAVPDSLRTVTLHNNRIELALHQLRDGGGRPLLLLHGLGEHTPSAVPPYLSAWPGPVWGMDFTGHGASRVPAGGGYYCEVLMADADAALAHLGRVTLHGRGLGAYVALLVAGARPEVVRGAVLDDGPGLAGGGPLPSTPYVVREPLEATGTPDPYALLELSQDVRPPDYATTYARQATTLSGLDTALAVCAVVRPPWLEAVASEPGVRDVSRDRCIDPFLGVD
jgi:pimeloyl-ACP methyl ester carboxylesterase